MAKVYNWRIWVKEPGGVGVEKITMKAGEKTSKGGGKYTFLKSLILSRRVARKKGGESNNTVWEKKKKTTKKEA